jgi:hypothetical protein
VVRLAPRAAPWCGGSLGPMHEDRTVVSTALAGEPRWGETRGPRQLLTGGENRWRGLGQMVWVLIL